MEGAGSTEQNQSSAERLISHGEQYLAQGNFVVARQYFQRAARIGHARAAFRLAETYDPNELPNFKTQGLNPDPTEAKRWYRAAAELGADSAQVRLARLNQQ